MKLQENIKKLNYIDQGVKGVKQENLKEMQKKKSIFVQNAKINYL